jgi:hypothetical protein
MQLAAGRLQCMRVQHCETGGPAVLLQSVHVHVQFASTSCFARKVAKTGLDPKGAESRQEALERTSAPQAIHMYKCISHGVHASLVSHHCRKHRRRTPCASVGGKGNGHNMGSRTQSTESPDARHAWQYWQHTSRLVGIHAGRSTAGSYIDWSEVMLAEALQDDLAIEDVQEVEMEAATIQQQFARFGAPVMRVPGDGWCLFHAVGEYLCQREHGQEAVWPRALARRLHLLCLEWYLAGACSTAPQRIDSSVVCLNPRRTLNATGNSCRSTSSWSHPQPQIPNRSPKSICSSAAGRPGPGFHSSWYCSRPVGFEPNTRLGRGGLGHASRRELLHSITQPVVGRRSAQQTCSRTVSVAVVASVPGHHWAL